MIRFFLLIIEKKRLPLLSEIVKEFNYILLQIQNFSRCTVYCVHIPPEEQQIRIQNTLCHLHHKAKVELHFVVDPSIIGGLIFEMEGITYDHSIRGKLKGLSRYLEEVIAT